MVPLGPDAQRLALDRYFVGDAPLAYAVVPCARPKPAGGSQQPVLRLPVAPRRALAEISAAASWETTVPPFHRRSHLPPYRSHQVDSRGQGPISANLGKRTRKKGGKKEMASRFMVPLKKIFKETDQEKRHAKTPASYDKRGRFARN
jgi:hypothetical protein